MSAVLLRMSPATRAILAGAATAALLWTARPQLMFQRDGRPRVAQWAARVDQVAQATVLPWWAAVTGVVLAIDLFV